MLFNSVEEMLAPEAMSALLSRQVTRVEQRPMNEHGGVAGGHLSYVDTNAGCFVLKRMSKASDWLMFTSDDNLCRAVTLWQYGLLDRLTPHMDHAIVACSRDANGWAIMMRDVSHAMLGDIPHAKPMTVAIINTLVDVLARQHANFWNDPLLDNVDIGLCDAAHHANPISMTLVRRYPNFVGSVIPAYVIEGWEIVDAENFFEADVKQSVHNLLENPQPLFDAFSRYPFTLIHGDFRAENLALPDGSAPVVLDWQIAARSLMTIDLTWLIGHNQIRLLMDNKQLEDFYRTRLETYLGQRFEDIQWQAMIDLGYLYRVLRSTPFIACWWKHTNDEKRRAAEEIKLRERSQQVRDGIRWL
jgi:hypothetical protein